MRGDPDVDPDVLDYVRRVFAQDDALSMLRPIVTHLENSSTSGPHIHLRTHAASGTRLVAEIPG